MQKVVNLLSLPVVRWAPALHIFTWDALRPPVRAGLDSRWSGCTASFLPVLCFFIPLLKRQNAAELSDSIYSWKRRVMQRQLGVQLQNSVRGKADESIGELRIHSACLLKVGNKKNTIKIIHPNREPTITAALLCRPSASESLTRSAGGEKVVVGFFSALRDSIQILRVSFLWVKLVCCGFASGQRQSSLNPMLGVTCCPASLWYRVLWMNFDNEFRGAGGLSAPQICIPLCKLIFPA